MKKLSLSIFLFATVMFVVNFIYTNVTGNVENEIVLVDVSIVEPANDGLLETQKTVPLVKTTTSEDISNKVSLADIDAEGAQDFFATKPNSLQTLPAPTALGVDMAGRLIIDHRVKTLFEHYLSAMGEESLDNVILRIKYDLYQQLTGKALETGIVILEGYLQYRNHLGILKNDYAQNHNGSTYDLASVTLMKQSVEAMRFSFFDEQTIIGLFSQEDEYDEYMMSRAQITSNSDMTQAEKNQALMLAEASAPSWISQNSAKSDYFASSRSTEKSLRIKGATDNEINQMREQAYGLEAANRLRNLDMQRQQWKVKLNAYRVQLTTLFTEGNASDIDSQYLDELRKEHFNAIEINRVKAMDKLELGI